MKRYLFLGLEWALVFFSLWAHHRFRAWTANRCTDSEAAFKRRPSEPAFSWVDWIGSLLLPLFLLLRQAPALAWIKPPEIDFDALRRPRRDGVRVALAGPLMNLLLALAAAAVAVGVKAAGLSLPKFLGDLLTSFCLSNACVGVFNLLPIPPLSGAAVAELFLKGDALTAFEEIKPYGFLLLVAGAYFDFFDFITLPLSQRIFSLVGR